MSEWPSKPSFLGQPGNKSISKPTQPTCARDFKAAIKQQLKLSKAGKGNYTHKEAKSEFKFKHMKTFIAYQM